jgi:hypothetical protein
LSYNELKEKIVEIEEKFPEIYQTLNYLIDKDKIKDHNKNRTKIGF